MRKESNRILELLRNGSLLPLCSKLLGFLPDGVFFFFFFGGRVFQDWILCFPQSCGNLVIKSHWSSRSFSLKTPRSFIRSPDWETWWGVPNLHSSGRTSLVLLSSSLWVTHLAGMGFDFVVIVLLLPSCCSCFLVFGHGISFFGGFHHSSEVGCSTTSYDFGVVPGEDEHTSFYSTISNQKLSFCFFYKLILIPVIHVN